MVMDPRLPVPNKSNEPVVGFDSFAISTDDLDGESISPAEPDEVSLYPTGSLGRNSGVGSGSFSSLDDKASLDPVLKYISQMLMEENMEEKAWMSPDHLALQNIEKSLFDALADQCPDLPDKFDNFDTSQLIGGRNSSLFGSSSKKSCTGALIATTSCNNSINPNWTHDPVGHGQTITSVVHPVDEAPQLNLNCRSPFYASSPSNSLDDANRFVQSPFLVKNIFDDYDSVMQSKRGFEEASKFLPPSSQLCIGFENVRLGSGAKGGIPEDVFHGSLERKNHNRREDLGFKEVRVPKQIAFYLEAEESELLDKFDKVLLCTEKVKPVRAIGNCLSTDASNGFLPSCARPHRSSGRKGRRRRQGNNNSSVDLGALLLMCAQAVSSIDVRTSNELLEQIRENSSPSGDGFQRSAHHFANGIEARMAGVAQSYYAAIVGKRRSAADMLNTHQLFL